MIADADPTSGTYAAFLPGTRSREAAIRATSAWWSWRGHEVHLALAARPDAPVRVLLVHGAGAHGAALWPMAALLSGTGADVTAVDLPLYGRTVSTDPASVRYDDWVALLVDLVATVDDAIDDVTRVEPRCLARRLACGALRGGRKRHTEVFTANVGREEDVEGALSRLGAGAQDQSLTRPR